MAVALVVKAGPLAGKRFELDKELVLGREGADVTIDDSEMSRRHAVVRPVDGGLEIEDLGSLNGTFVNEVRIEAATRLRGGDVVKVGMTSLAIEAPRAAETIASPMVAAAPSAAAGAAPSDPFGALAAEPMPRRRRGIASRQVLPTLFTVAAVVGTAVALAIYFSQHEVPNGLF